MQNKCNIEALFERLTNKKPIENFTPANGYILVFEFPFKREGVIMHANQKTQYANIYSESFSNTMIYGEVVKIGDKCELKIGDIVGYSRTTVGTNSIRMRLGPILHVPKDCNRTEDWQENELAILACCQIIKETDIHVMLT